MTLTRYGVYSLRMDLRRRRVRRQSGDLRQQTPPAVGSLNWHVFEHLVNIVLADDSSMPQMTDGQRFVFAVDYLRQEVNADGFEAYLDRAPASWQQPVIDSGDGPQSSSMTKAKRGRSESRGN